jgi:hypothetical protein
LDGLIVPIPVPLTGSEIAERFDAGRHVLDLLLTVDGSAEMVRLIAKIAPDQLQAAAFTSTCLLRLNGLTTTTDQPPPRRAA